MVIRKDLAAIDEPSTESAALIASILAQAGVSSALWGICAAALYGGELCQLDIELVINDADQERAFDILTSNNLQPSVPDCDEQQPLPISFKRWREQASSYQYRDRRRLRHSAPIYEITRSQPKEASATSFKYTPRMFIIIYSAEFVGLPPLPATNQPMGVSSEEAYVPVTALRPQLDPDIQLRGCLVPKFPQLVESEMHVLLQNTQPHSAAWDQHVCQLSALSRSRGCPGGPRHLPHIVAPKFSAFSNWIVASFSGEADYEALSGLRRHYSSAGQKATLAFNSDDMARNAQSSE